MEKWAHNLAEFVGIDDVEYFLHLAEEHNLLRRVNLWPILQKTKDDFFCERRFFLQELHHTVGKLRVIHRQRLRLVKGNQYSHQEGLVFLLEGESKSVND